MGLGVKFYRFKVGGKVGVGEMALELLPTSKVLQGNGEAVPQAVAVLFGIWLTGQGLGNET